MFSLFQGHLLDIPCCHGNILLFAGYFRNYFVSQRNCRLTDFKDSIACNKLSVKIQKQFSKDSDWLKIQDGFICLKLEFARIIHISIYD